MLTVTLPLPTSPSRLARILRDFLTDDSHSPIHHGNVHFLLPKEYSQPSTHFNPRFSFYLLILPSDHPHITTLPNHPSLPTHSHRSHTACHSYQSLFCTFPPTMPVSPLTPLSSHSHLSLPHSLLPMINIPLSIHVKDPTHRLSYITFPSSEVPCLLKMSQDQAHILTLFTFSTHWIFRRGNASY